MVRLPRVNVRENVNNISSIYFWSCPYLYVTHPVPQPNIIEIFFITFLNQWSKLFRLLHAIWTFRCKQCSGLFHHFNIKHLWRTPVTILTIIRKYSVPRTGSRKGSVNTLIVFYKLGHWGGSGTGQGHNVLQLRKNGMVLMRFKR